FEVVIARIVAEAQRIDPSLSACARVVVDDASRGPAYAVMSDEQLVFLRKVARTSGVLLDPVYTGKALFGLAKAVERGDVKRGARALFVHTGGLPGLLADDSVLESDA
ncbi:MAG: pyridoxal-phosphate dependent enzyme, partial [Polyangiaceae bacterium]